MGVYLVSVALLLLPSPLLVSLFFLREGTSTIYGQHGHHSFDSSLLSPSNHIGQAPIQQLWHPGQRARRSPESKLLPAGKVAKHSHSSRRTTLRQLLQW